jgi:hypothetical protein
MGACRLQRAGNWAAVHHWICGGVVGKAAPEPRAVLSLGYLAVTDTTSNCKNWPA